MCVLWARIKIFCWMLGVLWGTYVPEKYRPSARAVFPQKPNNFNGTCPSYPKSNHFNCTCPSHPKKHIISTARTPVTQKPNPVGNTSLSARNNNFEELRNICSNFEEHASLLLSSIISKAPFQTLAWRKKGLTTLNLTLSILLNPKINVRSKKTFIFF